MKLTKKQLAQIIREELEAVFAEEESAGMGHEGDMSRAYDEIRAADAKVVKRAVVRGPDGEEVELERTADMSNEEWENAKRVAMGGPPKKKLSWLQRQRKDSNRRYAIHKGRQERGKARAAMLAKGGEPQFEHIDREAEADAKALQSIKRAAKRAAHRAARGLSKARAEYDPRHAQEKRAAGYKPVTDKAKDDPRVEEVIDDFGGHRDQAKSTDHAGVSTSFLPMFEDEEAVLSEDDTMDAMVADEFSRFANLPGYEDERVPGKTASQVRRRDLPPEEFKYDDSHLRDLGYLEEMIREETEAVLAEVDPEQDAPGFKGYSERETNREASCKTWKAQGKSLPDWCDKYI